MKILVTGAGGYLGQGLVLPFAGRHSLRLMDLKSFASPHELFVGDVADLDAARRAVVGMDAILIAHMASRQAGAYDTPPLAFDVNVKGTANLFLAGIEYGIKKFCVISSTGVLAGHTGFWKRDSFPKGNDFYSLTKACQEVIAEQFQRVHQLSVSVLRVGWVMDADTMVDKYGQHRAQYCVGYTDRRDVGEAARLALERDNIDYEVFYVEGTSESADRCDIAYTRRRLGWEPKYDFKSLK
jgi:nucleoside-diphosphate-sugar epimerase